MEAAALGKERVITEVRSCKIFIHLDQAYRNFFTTCGNGLFEISILLGVRICD